MKNNNSEISLENPLLLKGIGENYNPPLIVEKEKDTDDVNYYYKEFIDEDNNEVVAVNSKSRTDFDIFLNLKYKSIINYHKINDIRYINKYFEKVNSLIPMNGMFIGNFESSSQRFRRLIRKYPESYAYVFHASTFIVKRVFPKWSFTKKIYFSLTKGKNRYLSLAEVLGRLVSCGFEIVDHKELNEITYFVTKKVNEPTFDKTPSYGALIKLKRIGQNGKEINVFKMRTMHPYAEYLQEYVHRSNDLKKGGKFKNDFRITNWGKIFRKLWIDELPMLINLVRGDLKFVGVRPLSGHYLSLYTEELRALRIKSKPGLFPPYYADMPKTLDEIMDSELNYLNKYFENPLKTDINYFIKIVKNIIFKGKRSG